jgi:hypothetical protein
VSIHQRECGKAKRLFTIYPKTKRKYALGVGPGWVLPIQIAIPIIASISQNPNEAYLNNKPNQEKYQSSLSYLVN